MAKEQREQGQRQHEQKVRDLQAELRQLSQTLGAKQDPLIGLSRDNARLAAELSQARCDRCATNWLSPGEAGRQAEALGQRLAALGLQIEDLLRAKNALEDMLTE